MANILSFEATRLSFINSSIFKLDKTTLREVILNLTELEEDLTTTKIFISVEKNRDGNNILFYKNKYYYNATRISDYLVAVIIKQYT